MEAEGLSVLVGSKDGTSGKKYSVKEVITHPNYGTTFLDYDVGLIKIKGKLKMSNSVKRAKLPKKEPKAGSEAVVVGWGETVNIAFVLFLCKRLHLGDRGMNTKAFLKNADTARYLCTLFT